MKMIEFDFGKGKATAREDNYEITKLDQLTDGQRLMLGNKSELFKKWLTFQKNMGRPITKYGYQIVHPLYGPGHVEHSAQIAVEQFFALKDQERDVEFSIRRNLADLAYAPDEE